MKLVGKIGTLAVALAVMLPTAAAHASVGPRWTVMPQVPMPKGAVAVELRDVVALSRGGVWVVGAWWSTLPNPLTAHFDGTAWTVVPVPEVGILNQRYDLTSIDATDGGSAWAVGNIQSSVSTGTAAVAMRHDGSSWSVTPTPIEPDGKSELNGVDMLSDDDGWAVGGTAADSETVRPLILRWGSGRWTRVPAPDTGAFQAELNSVHALSENDVWAVGWQASAGGRRVGLALHWDSHAWSQVPVPDLGNDDEALNNIAAVGPAEVWAVGRTCQTPLPSRSCRPLVLRFSAQQWQVIPTTDTGTELTDVIAFSSTDVWVIGYSTNTLLPETDHAEHWDGTRFQTEEGTPGIEPADGEPASALAAASALSPQELWAVGWADGTSGFVSHTVRRL